MPGSGRITYAIDDELAHFVEQAAGPDTPKADVDEANRIARELVGARVERRVNDQKAANLRRLFGTEGDRP